MDVDSPENQKYGGWSMEVDPNCLEEGAQGPVPVPTWVDPVQFTTLQQLEAWKAYQDSLQKPPSPDTIGRKRSHARRGPESATPLVLIDSLMAARSSRDSRGSSVREMDSLRRSVTDTTALAALDPRVTQLLSFETQRHLLRASGLTRVMQGGAGIFSSSAGSEATYALSKEVKQIDNFISHNWVVPRTKKFMCLALHFNFLPAMVTMMVSIGVIATLKTVDKNPVVQLGSDPFECWATALACPIFCIVLFSWHSLQRCVGLSGPSVFLDKTCIHQVDQRLQREGIKKLGAFIRRSRHMVVIYTDVYLKKLWTVYEVACFLSLHDTQDMTIIPTYSATGVFGGLAILYTGTVLRIFVSSTAIHEELSFYIAYTLAAFAGAGVLRYAAHTKQAIRQRMEGFRVQECTCFCEEDRPLVYKNIALLMAASNKVGEHADESVALYAFNALARKDLSNAMLASVGPVGLRYSHVVAIFCCTYLAAGVDHFLVPSLTLAMRLSKLLLYCIWVAGLFPLMVAGLSVWCSRGLEWKGCLLWTYVGCGPVVLLGASVAVNVLLTMLQEAAAEGNAGAMAGMCLVLLGVTMLAHGAYSGALCASRVPRRKQHAASWQESFAYDSDEEERKRSKLLLSDGYSSGEGEVPPSPRSNSSGKSPLLPRSATPTTPVSSNSGGGGRHIRAKGTGWDSADLWGSSDSEPEPQEKGDAHGQRAEKDDDSEYSFRTACFGGENEKGGSATPPAGKDGIGDDVPIQVQPQRAGPVAPFLEERTMPPEPPEEEADVFTTERIRTRL